MIPPREVDRTYDITQSLQEVLVRASEAFTRSLQLFMTFEQSIFTADFGLQSTYARAWYCLHVKDSTRNNPTEHQAWVGSPLACHTQGVHRNLRTNPVDPSSPLQKLTHTMTIICFTRMHTEFHRLSYVWFGPPHGGYVVSVRRTRLDALLRPVDPCINKGLTDLYPSGGYTHPVTCAIELSHSACTRLSFDQKSFLSFSQQLIVFFHFF